MSCCSGGHPAKGWSAFQRSPPRALFHLCNALSPGETGLGLLPLDHVHGTLVPHIARHRYVHKRVRMESANLRATILARGEPPIRRDCAHAGDRSAPARDWCRRGTIVEPANREWETAHTHRAIELAVSPRAALWST
eukprot:gene20062-biopygen6487